MRNCAVTKQGVRHGGRQIDNACSGHGPAAGVVIWLYRVSGNSHRKLVEIATNDDGRSDSPLLAGKDLTVGTYELVFHAGDYLRRTGQAGDGVLFLDQIPIRFGITDAEAHYHVPLLLQPFGYSTYRGS